MDILTTVIPFFAVIIAILMSLLPVSPFQGYISQLGDVPWLTVLNWFVPVPEMIAVFQSWVSAYGVFVAYKALMRYIKVI